MAQFSEEEKASIKDAATAATKEASELVNIVFGGEHKAGVGIERSVEGKMAFQFFVLNGADAATPTCPLSQEFMEFVPKREYHYAIEVALVAFVGVLTVWILAKSDSAINEPEEYAVWDRRVNQFTNHLSHLSDEKAAKNREKLN